MIANEYEFKLIENGFIHLGDFLTGTFWTDRSIDFIYNTKIPYFLITKGGYSEMVKDVETAFHIIDYMEMKK